MKTQLLTIFSILLFSSFAVAQEAEENKYLNVGDDRIAIKGYDPVSYFTSDEPKEGNENLSHAYNGAIYYFSSQENLDTFKADPAKYEPAYGGWCAYAMGKGYTADANPKTYKILDGKLLLFYNKLLVNTLPRWNKDEATLYPSAEKNWEEKSFKL
ncbi:MAG: YHS domain-containing protein [Balneola sp.]|nr:MAG: YHS domain-containing protein [Balneola sp.]